MMGASEKEQASLKPGKVAHRQMLYHREIDDISQTA